MDLFILGLLQKASRGGGGGGNNISGTLEMSGFFAETIIGPIITEGDE